MLSYVCKISFKSVQVCGGCCEMFRGLTFLGHSVLQFTYFLSKLVRPFSVVSAANRKIKHLINGLFPGITWLKLYQNNKIILHFYEAKKGLGTTMTSAGPYANNLHPQKDNHTNTSSLVYISAGRVLFLLSNRPSRSTDGKSRWTAGN